MPTDEQKQKQQEELKRVGERILRSEGGVYALKYAEDSLERFKKPGMLGDTPEQALSNITLYLGALREKAESDLGEAQGALGAALAEAVGSVPGMLQKLAKAAQASPRVVSSKEFQERSEARAPDES